MTVDNITTSTPVANRKVADAAIESKPATTAGVVADATSTIARSENVEVSLREQAKKLISKEEADKLVREELAGQKDSTILEQMKKEYVWKGIDQEKYLWNDKKEILEYKWYGMKYPAPKEVQELSDRLDAESAAAEKIFNKLVDAKFNALVDAKVAELTKPAKPAETEKPVSKTLKQRLASPFVKIANGFKAAGSKLLSGLKTVGTKISNGFKWAFSFLPTFGKKA